VYQLPTANTFSVLALLTGGQKWQTAMLSTLNVTTNAGKMVKNKNLKKWWRQVVVI